MPQSTRSAIVCCLVLWGRLQASRAQICTTDEFRSSGGWNLTAAHGYLFTTACSIDRVPALSFSDHHFQSFYYERAPVIITGLTNAAIQDATVRDALLEEYGNAGVLLSTANTISHTKTPALLRDYIEKLKAHDPDQLGNETLYLFGPSSELGGALGPLIELYHLPPFAGDDVAISFGIGGSGSGVPFHVHGSGFSEVLHGKKRWLLYPPHHKPPFDPDASSATWLRDVHHTLKGGDKALLQDCMIQPGQALYFPSMWWHATVNVGEAVFVSAFLGRADPIRRPTRGSTLFK